MTTQRLRAYGPVALPAAALASIALPPCAPRAALVTAALLFSPGRALLALLDPPALGPVLRAALALALSPFLVGAAASLFLLAGFGGLLAGVLCLALLLAVEIWVARGAPGWPWRSGAADPDRGGSLRVPRRTALLLVLLTALVLHPAWISNRVRASIHGMLHASILYSLVDRGAPPENPFFAGEPLRYYWTWHAGAAAAVETGGVEPTAAFAAHNAAALLSFLLLLAGLGVHLFGRAALALPSALLGFCSLGALGVLEMLRKAPLADLDAIARGVDPVNYIKALTLHDDRISCTFTKFLNVSSFPSAFALLAATWLLWLLLLRRRGAALFLLTALAQAGCIALSPITGAVGGLALGIVTLARMRWNRRAALIAAAALVAGLFLGAPFVLLGTGDAEDVQNEPVVQLDHDPGRVREKVEDALFGLGPALLLALPALLSLRRRGDELALGLSAPLLLALGVALSFPVRSEYKMVRMAAPLLGVLAAGAFSARGEGGGRARRWLPYALLLPFLPSQVVAWNAYRRHAEASLPYFGEGPLLRVDPSRHPVAEAYDWLRENTPEDAVVLADPRSRAAHHFAGPHHGEETPVLAHRPIFTDLRYYMTDYEPDFPKRMALLSRLFGGAPLPPADYQALHRLRRPVYLLLRAFDPGFARASLGAAADGHWKVVFRTPAAVVYRLVR